VAPEFPLPRDPSNQTDLLPERLLQDLTRVVEDLNGHALALTLAGNYLVEHKQDLRALQDLPLRVIEIALTRRIADQLQSDPELTATETAFAHQLLLLYFLGLFDRPVDARLLPITFPPARPSGKPRISN